MPVLCGTIWDVRRLNTVSNFSYILPSGTPRDGMALIRYGERGFQSELKRAVVNLPEQTNEAN